MWVVAWLACGWGTGVGVDDAQRVGQLVQRAMGASECDPAALERVIDVDALADHAFHGMWITFDRREAAKVLAPALVARLCSVARTAEVELVHVGGGWRSARPVLRLLDDEGFDYVELALARREGRPQVIDVLFYSVGISIAELIQSAVEPPSGGGLSVSERDQLLRVQRRLAEASQDGSTSQVHMIVGALPEDLRAHPSLLRWRLAASEPTGDGHDALLAAFSKAFPDSPSIPMYEWSAAWAQGAPERAIVALRQLQERVGPDPYLEAEIGLALVELDRLDDAEAAFAAARDAAPSLFEPRWGLVTVAAKRGDHAAVDQRLTALCERGDLDVAAALALPLLAAFRESNHGARWLDRTCP